MEGTTEKDERGRVIRHLQAPASAGGCAICKCVSLLLFFFETETLGKDNIKMEMFSQVLRS
jgi:hypothetical protein